MLMEILGGIIDWSEPHAVRVRQVASRLKRHLPKAIPFIMREVLPLLTAILGEDKMNLLTDPEKLVASMPELEEAIAMAFIDNNEEDEKN